MLPEDRFIRLDGKDHPLRTPSTAMYLKAIKGKKVRKDSDDIESQTQMSIDLITMAAPSIPRERLIELPLPMLTRISDSIDEMFNEMTAAANDGKPVIAEEDDESGE